MEKQGMQKLYHAVVLVSVCAFIQCLSCAGCSPLVTQLPFFKQLLNPCGIQQRPLNDLSLTTPDGIRHEVLHTAWLTKVQTDNLQISMHISECSGLSLASLPPVPKIIDEKSIESLKTLYRSLVYHAAHLYFIAHEHDSSSVVCINKSQNSADEFRRVAGKLVYLQCNLLQLLSSDQSIRPTTQEIKELNFHYQNDCSARWTRDCVVLMQTQELIKELSRTKLFQIEANSISL